MNVCQTTVVESAWERGQDLSVHGWIYRLNDGRVRDLRMNVSATGDITAVPRGRGAETDHAAADLRERRLTFQPGCLQFCQMRPTISVRLPADLAAWLESTALRAGVSRSSIIKEKLEEARAVDKHHRGFMRLAGCINGPRDLSSRRGFSKK